MMTLLHRLASILAWIRHRDRAERRLDDELQAYLEMSAAEKIRNGALPAEARRLARIELGGLEQAKERVRTYRHGAGVDEIGRDVRYAFRLFRKNPAFTIAIILTLALGIGANTAIFSLIDALMLRSLPVRNPNELVQLTLQPRGGSGPGGDTFSYAIVRALAEQREIFAGLAGFNAFPFEVGVPGAAARVRGAVVTGDFYDTLGLTPAIGRLITKQDDAPGAPPVAVLSYRYWEQQFARSPGVIGQVLRVDGTAISIVGVSPRGFVGANVGAVADLTMPVAAIAQVAQRWESLLGPGNFWLRILARPQRGVSNDQAAAHLNATWHRIAGDLIPSYWPANLRTQIAGSVFHLTPGGTGSTPLRETYTNSLFVLMAIVALVLLIACANVASLLLARASVRRREMAVRLAMGAARGRIVRQLLIESTLLSSIAAAAGIALAWVLGQFLIELISKAPGEIVLDLTPNAHVLSFTAAVAIATGILFGLAPAFQATDAGPAAALKRDSRTTGPRSRLLSWLVTGQLAISLVLLAGAALFVRTLQNLQNLDPGFNSEGVLLAELDGRRAALPQTIIDEVRQLPMVVSAALTSHTPLSGWRWSEPAVPEGQPIPDGDNALFVAAGPGFFETMQMQMLAGREFNEHDTASRPRLAIINQAFAERHFRGVNPVGQRLSARMNGQRTGLEIIGLVKDTRWIGLRAAPYPTVYVAYSEISGDTFSTVALRASGGFGTLPSALQQLLQSKVPGGSFDVHPLSAQVEATLVQERMMAKLAGAFGVLALILVSVGVYGLLAYSVAQRTKEIGIRMALGAHTAWVVKLVLRDGARLLGAGILLGLPVAWVATRWTKSLLFGVTPMDPGSIGAALVVLASAALVAAYFPARRASRLDPLHALRHD